MCTNKMLTVLLPRLMLPGSVLPADIRPGDSGKDNQRLRHDTAMAPVKEILDSIRNLLRPVEAKGAMEETCRAVK